MPRLGQTLKPLVKLGSTPDACWTWLGSCRKDNGVAFKQFAGRLVPARRWIWEQLFGPIPDGHVIGQECGNNGCINPHHLKKYGSMADALRAGASATLTPGDVTEIRALKGQSRAEAVAGKYGVSVATVRDVWRGTTWRSKPKHHSAATPSRDYISPEQNT